MFQYISCCYLSQAQVLKQQLELLFQYISCCYLSYLMKSVKIVLNCFNTSHVVIYRKKNTSNSIGNLCFNTSHVVIYQEKNKRDKNMYKFQYISCCYLSQHLTLFLPIIYVVSIHLMLLFIATEEEQTVTEQAFQYISCCYLSLSDCRTMIMLPFVSIHLMLLFINI